MGLRFSKLEPVKAVDSVGRHGHFHFLSFLTRKFYLHHLVSKKRRRLLVGGYDLDMSYITDRILAMSFPAERARAMYRNPLWQVKSVLDMRHSGHYKVCAGYLHETIPYPGEISLRFIGDEISTAFVTCSNMEEEVTMSRAVPLAVKGHVYNLCVEESYDPSNFHGRVEVFPFDDNHVPSLDMMKNFCESVHSWLSVDPKNIAVIHCMAGKGRTGLMVCAYLVYSGMSAEEALQLYAQRRTINNEGVSIPSQRRYVGYWSDVLTRPKKFGLPPQVNLPQPCSRELRRIRLYDTTNTNPIFFVVSELQKVPGQLYQPSVEVAKSCCREVKKGCQRTYSPRYFLSFIENDGNEVESETETPRVVVQMDTENSAIDRKACLDYYFDKPLRVTGDVRVIFYQKLIGGRLFYACFNTSFISNCFLQFSVSDLDKVGYNGRCLCGPSFCLELLFGPTNGKSASSSDEDILSKNIAICHSSSCEEDVLSEGLSA